MMAHSGQFAITSGLTLQLLLPAECWVIILELLFTVHNQKGHQLLTLDLEKGTHFMYAVRETNVIYWTVIIIHFIVHLHGMLVQDAHKKVTIMNWLLLKNPNEITCLIHNAIIKI